MAWTSDINLSFGYSDETKRKLVIGPFSSLDDENKLAEIKAKIKAFNSTGVADVANLILSDGGASCTGIVDASVTVANVTEIVLK